MLFLLVFWSVRAETVQKVDETLNPSRSGHDVVCAVREKLYHEYSVDYGLLLKTKAKIETNFGLPRCTESIFGESNFSTPYEAGRELALGYNGRQSQESILQFLAQHSQSPCSKKVWNTEDSKNDNPEQVYLGIIESYGGIGLCDYERKQSVHKKFKVLLDGSESIEHFQQLLDYVETLVEGMMSAGQLDLEIIQVNNRPTTVWKSSDSLELWCFRLFYLWCSYHYFVATYFLLKA